jgi:hypothetical protein
MCVVDEPFRPRLDPADNASRLSAAPRRELELPPVGKTLLAKSRDAASSKLPLTRSFKLGLLARLLSLRPIEDAVVLLDMGMAGDESICCVKRLGRRGVPGL